jgi:hypothetical protein
MLYHAITVCHHCALFCFIQTTFAETIPDEVDLTTLRDFLLAPEPDYGESAAATIAAAAVAAAASFGFGADGGGSGSGSGNDGSGIGSGGIGGGFGSADGSVGGTNLTDMASAIGELLGDSPLAISRYQVTIPNDVTVRKWNSILL